MIYNKRCNYTDNSMVLSRWLFNNSKKFILRTKGELKVMHFEQNIEYFSEHRNVMAIKRVIFKILYFYLLKGSFHQNLMNETNKNLIVLTRTNVCTKCDIYILTK